MTLTTTMVDLWKAFTSVLCRARLQSLENIGSTSIRQKYLVQFNFVTALQNLTLIDPVLGYALIRP